MCYYINDHKFFKIIWNGTSQYHLGQYTYIIYKYITIFLWYTAFGIRSTQRSNIVRSFLIVFALMLNTILLLFVWVKQIYLMIFPWVSFLAYLLFRLKPDLHKDNIVYICMHFFLVLKKISTVCLLHCSLPHNQSWISFQHRKMGIWQFMSVYTWLLHTVAAKKCLDT